MDSSSYSPSASPTTVNANFNTTRNNTWHSNTIYYPYNHRSGCCQRCKIMWHTLFPKIKSHLVYSWQRGGGSHSGSYGTYRTTCTCPKKYHIGHTVATKKGPTMGIVHPQFCFNFLLRSKTYLKENPGPPMPNWWGCGETGLHTL